MIRSIIIGTGSCIPDQVVSNNAFERNQFYESSGTKLYIKNESIIGKFAEITGIHERRYASADQHASSLGLIAAKSAISAAGVGVETLDYIIVAHNFGDISFESNRTSQVPSLASRLKAVLGIKNSACVAYDLVFGCPGWIEGVVQADCFIRLGMANRVLVVGCETLSRVLDPHDRDSMIYSDGSGAVVLERSQEERGVITHKTRTFADEAHLLHMSPSYAGFTESPDDLYLKMHGRKVYEFALTNVPLVIKEVIDSAGIALADVKKVLVHQANEKMDKAILLRLFRLYQQDAIPENLMPMTISWLGNSSVATVPTLLDLIVRKKLVGHELKPGDYIMMASVGAGMSVNALLYQY